MSIRFWIDCGFIISVELPPVRNSLTEAATTHAEVLRPDQIGTQDDRLRGGKK
jgi:hypothetical protein